MIFLRFCFDIKGDWVFKLDYFWNVNFFMLFFYRNNINKVDMILNFVIFWLLFFFYYYVVCLLIL